MLIDKLSDFSPESAGQEGYREEGGEGAGTLIVALSNRQGRKGVDYRKEEEKRYKIGKRRKKEIHQKQSNKVLLASKCHCLCVDGLLIFKM